MKRRELERHLRSSGAELLREGARHSVWAIGGADSERIAAVPRHSEIKPGHRPRDLQRPRDPASPRTLN